MARIDKFIEAAFKHAAEEMVLCPGEKIYLVRQGQRRSLSAQEVEIAQIRSVLLDVVPEEHRSALNSGESVEFPYLSPSGPVVIIASDESVRVRPRELGLSGADATGMNGTGSASGAGGAAVGGAAIGGAAAEGSLDKIAGSISPRVSGGVNGASIGQGVGSLLDNPPDASGGEAKIDHYLAQMVGEGCSDLHLCAGYPPLFRKDGDIADLGGVQDLDSGDVEALLKAITPSEDWDTFLECNDVDFAYEIEGVARFRCNLFRDRQGMGGVFRTIPSIIPTAEKLGLTGAIMELTNLHKGLVVVTGPTGSGKSTTLAAMIDHINREQARHVITIEDPIEFVHPRRRALINQREIGTHTASFRAALRAALREDPDIVLLGEMRDLETVEIALETAETGHLVFGTLHTNTAASTVDRIIDQFSSDQQAQIRVLLSETLKGVIAQTLCKRKGGGRVAAHEILLVTSAISNLIREGKTFQIPSLMQTGRGQGMKTLDHSLMELAQAGTIEIDEAYNRSLTKNEFKTMMERNGMSLSKAA